jgi:hypothetical protein
MDKKNLVSIVSSIHFETELLEALDWDEDKLKDITQKLSEYFAVCSKSDLDLIKVDLGFIFSEEISNIVAKYVRHVKSELQEGENNEV